MLLVKTAVKPSKIAGMGLFAEEDIKAGTPVWQYTPRSCNVMTFEQIDFLTKSYHKSNEFFSHILTYGYYQAHLGGLILCLDNGRFVNHSEQPNLTNASHMPKEIGWQYSIACRDIMKGEELTEDYRTYDSAEWLNELCQKYGVFHYELEASKR